MMSNGAPSADANIGDGGASRDGRIMTGGMTSGAATRPLGAVAASSDGTLSHTQLSDGATSHCEASDGRIMTGGTLSGAAATTDQA